MHEGHRERMLQKVEDRTFLYDHEVLEVLLFYARPRVNTNPLAHLLLSRFGTLTNVVTAKEEELKQVEGVGDEIVAFFGLVKELYKISREGMFSLAVSRNFNELHQLVDSRFSKMRSGYMYILFFLRSGELRCILPFKEGEVFDTSSATFRKLLTLIAPVGIVIVHCRGKSNYSFKDECLRLMSIRSVCTTINCLIYNYFVYDNGVLVHNFRYDCNLDDIYDTLGGVDTFRSYRRQIGAARKSKLIDQDDDDLDDEDDDEDEFILEEKTQPTAKIEAAIPLKAEDEIDELKLPEKASAKRIAQGTEQKQETKQKKQEAENQQEKQEEYPQLGEVFTL